MLGEANPTPWMINFNYYKVWDIITYPLRNVISHFTGHVITYPLKISYARLKITYASKRDPQGTSILSTFSFQPMRDGILWQCHYSDGITNAMTSQITMQPHDCLLNRLFRRRSKKTSKLRVTDLYWVSSPVTDEFPAQRAINAENVSIWWRHHGNVVSHLLIPSRMIPDSHTTYVTYCPQMIVGLRYQWSGLFMCLLLI